VRRPAHWVDRGHRLEQRPVFEPAGARTTRIGKRPIFGIFFNFVPWLEWGFGSMIVRVTALGHSPLSKEDDYRQNAAETMRMAQRASSISDKGRLLKLVEAWLDLADRAHKAARRTNLRP
jgi:hypothetical protein